MRYPVVVLLALLCCRGERLTHARDPQCDTPCYDGDSTKAGKGICTYGEWKCDEEGTIVSCEGSVNPQPRTCNGLDNDCDGNLDSDLVFCHTACGTGIQTCDRGQLRNDCTAREPTLEVCNNRDDDCDGQVDEVLELPVTPCYGGNSDAGELVFPYADCRPGTIKCESGRPVCRNDKRPTPETCDEIDNNCNGEVNEGLSDCNGTGGTSYQSLHVELSWSHPNDMDAHLQHPDAGDPHLPSGWGHYTFDCFYANRTPNWDNPDSGQDDPTLDRDDTTGTGPENITIPTPSTLHPYTIGIHSYNWAAQPTNVIATVKVYCGGVLKATETRSFDGWKQTWVVGTIQFTSSGQCIYTPDGFVIR